MKGRIKSHHGYFALALHQDHTKGSLIALLELIEKVKPFNSRVIVECLPAEDGWMKLPFFLGTDSTGKSENRRAVRIYILCGDILVSLHYLTSKTKAIWPILPPSDPFVANAYSPPHTHTLAKYVKYLNSVQ